MKAHELRSATQPLFVYTRWRFIAVATTAAPESKGGVSSFESPLSAS